MSNHTSITLGRHFDSFIKKQVKSGRFATASEVVRAGLRRLEEDEAKLAALRGALADGERSGLADDYSLEAVLTEVRGKSKSH
jgi:antitoxin ParD1/3/4